MEHDSEYRSDSEVAEDFELPPMYKVIFLNDDFTTMEFVTDVLMSVFKKSLEEANAIMLQVHKEGKGLVGVYPYDVAATRATLTIKKARAQGFPLQCTLEKC